MYILLLQLFFGVGKNVYSEINLNDYNSFKIDITVKMYS